MKGFVRWALAPALLCAAWATWPVVTCLDACVVDPTGVTGSVAAAFRRDVDLVRWILAWDVHALTTQPAALFDANIFHPAPDALTTTEHLLGALPLYAPVALATGNPLLAHQTTLLLTFVLASLTAGMLIVAWTGSPVAGALAGLLFAYSPFRATHLPALHVEGTFYLPLVVLGLWRSATSDDRRWPVFTAIALTLQGLYSFYLGYAAFVTVAVILAIVLSGDPRARARWIHLLAPVVVAGAVVGVGSIPYLKARAAGGLPGPDPAFVSWASSRPFKTGATASLLLAIATAPWWHRGVPGLSRAWLVGLCAVALIGHALALGPAPQIAGVALPAPFALAERVIPGWALIRAPIRLNALPAFAAPILAGIGIAGLLQHARARGTLVFGATATTLAMATIASVRLAFPPVALTTAEPPTTVPPVYAWLADQAPEPFVAIPFHDFRLLGPGMDVEARRMVRGLLHFHPMLGGYSGYAPPTYPAVAALVRALPDPRALELLQRLTGLRRVVVHRAELASSANEQWRVADDRFITETTAGDDVVLRPRTLHDPDLRAAFVGGSNAAETPLGTPRAPLPPSARQAVITLDAPPRPGPHAVAVRITVAHRGTHAWPACGAGTAGLVTIGYRWRNAQGRVHIERQDAGRFPWDVQPGETLDATIAVAPPGRGGPYAFEVGLVQDGVWFP